MKDVFLPLQGPGAPAPKAPAVQGWQSPTYEGVLPPEERAAYDDNHWLGLRTDQYVVVDCDTPEAAQSWLAAHPDARDTWVRKTPHGFHFIYSTAPGAPSAPAVEVLPRTDVRAGIGSQIVLHAPGYADVAGHAPSSIAPFNPAWMSNWRRPSDVGESEDWTTVPEGRRNSTLTAFGGALRKQGMAYEEILRMLATMNKHYCDPPIEQDEVMLIARSVSRYEADPNIDIELIDDEVEAETADDLTDRPYWRSSEMTLKPPPPWLWRDYLPEATLTLLEGEEGIGKGLCCAWLAVQVVSGASFGDPKPPRNVLWYTAEDDPDDVLRRLYAAGYSPEAGHADVIFRNPRFDRLAFPGDIESLQRIVKQMKPGLIIMDPGRSFLAPDEKFKTDGSLNSEQNVRPGMERLNLIAHDTGVPIVFVHHWNKSKEGDSRSKSGGSGAFRQVARQALVVARYLDEHAISVEKANNSSTGGTLATYNIEVDPEDGTAWFTMGGKLPQENIDEWLKEQKEADSAGGIGWIALDVTPADVRQGFAVNGGMAPTATQVQDVFQIDNGMAVHLISQLEEMGWTKNRHWIVGAT